MSGIFRKLITSASNTDMIWPSTLAATTAMVMWYSNSQLLKEKASKCETNKNSNKAEAFTSKEKDHDDDMFYDYIPMKQLHKPTRPYPAWDDNWDGRKEKTKSADGKSSGGITRHIILVRHGQYDETYHEDYKRILTPLGREQADKTGKRLAELIKGFDDKFAPCNVRFLRVSDMARAKETADIIAKHLPSQNLQRTKPDPLLNEGIPAKIIPLRPDLDIEEDYQQNHQRIEEAFRKYIHRGDDEPVSTLQMIKNVVSSSEKKAKVDKEEDPEHEFEIIVCHGNVIRYFFCRALQLPPEAWLRLGVFNCSLTYLMVKPDGRTSCRLLGDIGHLGYDHSTFSMMHGFVW